MLEFKCLSRRYLSLNKRDTHGLQAIDRIRIKIIKNHICNIISVVKTLRKLNL